MFSRHLFLFLIIFTAMADLSPQTWAMAKRPSFEEEKPAEPQKIVLTLENTYRRALQRSETIAIRKEEITKTHADWMIATGDFIGDGDFVITNAMQPTSSGSGESSVGSTLTKVERRERKYVFSQPLFQGFKSLGALTGAGGLTKQRKAEYRYAKELLFLEVVEAYYNLFRQKKDLETIEGIRQLLGERIDELKQRAEIGRSRSSEVATAESKMNLIEAQLAKSRGALAIAESLMEFYAGVPAEQSIYQEEDLPGNEILKPQDDAPFVDRRPDVAAAQQAMKVAKKAIVVAQSDLWPKITLDANRYEKREGFQSGIDWDLLFKINVPLFRGGETLGAVKKSYSAWKQAKLNYSLVRRQAELEIKEAYQNGTAALEQDKAFQKAVKASQENYRYQKEDYARSLVNNLDVLSALEELFSTSRAANLAHYEMKQNYWRYHTAIGDCCEKMS